MDGAILPKHVLEGQDMTTAARKPIGAGPYRLAKGTPVPCSPLRPRIRIRGPSNLMRCTDIRSSTMFLELKAGDDVPLPSSTCARRKGRSGTDWAYRYLSFSHTSGSTRASFLWMRASAIDGHRRRRLLPCRSAGRAHGHHTSQISITTSRRSGRMDEARRLLDGQAGKE
ncbi:MAG: hypothetical protein ACLR7Z_10940 [Bilophila wadsworthia]